MSALGDRRYALARMAALIAARPASFAVSVLLAAFGLAVPLAMLAMALSLAPRLEASRLSPEVTIHLAPTLAARDVDAARNAVAGLAGVRQVHWIPRDQALSELLKRHGLGTAEGRANPLPDVLVARFAAGIDPERVAQGVDRIKAVPGVTAVRADLDWYRRLLAVARPVGVAMIGLAALTLVLALSTLASLVRERATAGRAEAEILRLAGARPAFVARPYAYLGACGLTLAVLLALGLAGSGLFWLQGGHGLTALTDDAAQASSGQWLPAAASLPVLGWIVGLGLGRLAAWSGLRSA